MDFQCSITEDRYFGVVFLGNTDKATPPYREELMVELSIIVDTHMIEKRWTVLAGSDQISLDNIKSGVAITKK